MNGKFCGKLDIYIFVLIRTFFIDCKKNESVWFAGKHQSHDDVL